MKLKKPEKRSMSYDSSAAMLVISELRELMKDGDFMIEKSKMRLHHPEIEKLWKRK